MKKLVDEKIKLFIKNMQSSLKISESIKILIRRCCYTVLNLEQFNKATEISVMFVNDKKMKFLNFNYRNINKSTDVLSFPLKLNDEFEVDGNGVVILGDIIISTETAIKQAVKFNQSIEKEICFLIVHSMFHLLGYDHETNENEANIMRLKERQVLQKLNID